MNNFLEKNIEQSLEISRELRELAAKMPHRTQYVMVSAAAVLEFMSGYIAGLESKAKNGSTGNFFQTLTKEENATLSSALLEYRSHLGRALDEYYRAEELTDELRSRAAEIVSAINKLNEWIAELYGEGNK